MITDKQINEGLGQAYKKAGHNAYFGNGFEAGVNFAQELVNNLTIPITMPSLHEIDFLIMRKKKGFTLRKVTKLTGVSDGYLSQLENGKIKNPSYKIVKLLYELYINKDIKRTKNLNYENS